MTSYRPSAIFSPRARIGRLQFLVGFGYLWLLSVGAATVMIWAQTLPPWPRIALNVLAVATSIGIWGLIALWLKARLSDAGMSSLWIGILGLLFLSELRAAAVDPKPIAEPFASVAGWDELRSAAAAGTLALLLVLAVVRGRKAPKVVLDDTGEQT